MLRRFSRLNSIPHYTLSEDGELREKPASDDATKNSYILAHEEYQYLNLIHDIIQENQLHVLVHFVYDDYKTYLEDYLYIQYLESHL